MLIFINIIIIINGFTAHKGNYNQKFAPTIVYNPCNAESKI